MYDTSSRVLNTLNFVELLCGKAIRETTAVINAIGEKSLHNFTQVPDTIISGDA